MLKRLIDLGIDVNRANISGKRPIHAAAAIGSVELLIYLIETGADCSVIDNIGNSVIHHACHYYKNHGMFKQFIGSGFDFDCKNNMNETPLIYAGRLNNFTATKFLLKQNVDVNIRDVLGNSPLHYSVDFKFEITKILIKKGANVNAKNNSGKTPLFYI